MNTRRRKLRVALVGVFVSMMVGAAGGVAIAATPGDGAVAIGADVWNKAHFTGRGVRVGVIDVDFHGWGRLKGSEKISTWAGKNRTFPSRDDQGSGHGTIVTDVLLAVAPDVELFLASASVSEIGCAVEWMRGEDVPVSQDCDAWVGLKKPVDVITMSIAGDDGTGIRNGMNGANGAVDKAISSGIVWVQAAGNTGLTEWTGSFRDRNRNNKQEFQGDGNKDCGDADGINLGGACQGTSRSIEVILRRSDGGGDYTVCLEKYNILLGRLTGWEEVACSKTSRPDGIAKVLADNRLFFNYRLVVRKYPNCVGGTSDGASCSTDTQCPRGRCNASDADRLRLSLGGCAADNVYASLACHTSAGTIRIPADNARAISVGAAPVTQWPPKKNSDVTKVVASYSSRGPTEISLGVPNLAIFPKPEIIGPSPVQTDLGLQSEPGTSFAAPHVAGAVALIIQSGLARGVDVVGAVRTALFKYAVPIGGGRNNTSGYGVLQLGPPPPDSDQDGVADGADQCANTPSGDVVDRSGCSCSQKTCPDDGNPCTNDYCDTATAQCVHAYNINECDDGNPCTVDDRCGNGVCQGITITCNHNGVTDVACGEHCDGADLGGATCQSQGFDCGTVSCNGDCTLNTGACARNECASNGTRCLADGTTLQTCLDSGSGCLTWGSNYQCVNGCVNGACAPPPVPSATATPTPTPTAAAPWPMFGHDAQHTGASSFVGPQMNNLRWSLATGGAVHGSPVIGQNGTVYFTSDDGYLNAANADGTTWRVFVLGDLPAAGWGLRAPAIGADGTVYVAGGESSLQAFTADGNVKWMTPPTFPVGESPIIDGNGVVYFTRGASGNNGCLEAVRDQGTTGTVLWQNCGSLWGSPAVGPDGSRLYVPSGNGQLVSVDPTSGTVVSGWGGSKLSVVVDSQGTTYFGSSGCSFEICGGLYWAIRADGTGVWSDNAVVAFWGWGDRAVSALAGGRVYFVNGNSLTAARTSDGVVVWSFPLSNAGGVGINEGGASPAVDAQGNVYIGSSTGTFYAINPDGTEKWHYQTGGAINTQPAIGPDGTLYVGSDDGKVYAFGQGGGLAPTPAPIIDGYTTIPFGQYDLKQFSYQSNNALGSFDGPNGEGQVLSVGQIIHPQFSGTTSSISLKIEKYGSPTWNAQLFVYDYKGSVTDPAGELLAQSVSINASNFATGSLDWYSFALTSPLSITADHWYYLEVRTDTNTFSTSNFLYFDVSFGTGYGGYDAVGDPDTTEIVGLAGISGLDGYSCAHTPPPVIRLYPTTCGPPSYQSYDMLFDLGGIRQ